MVFNDCSNVGSFSQEAFMSQTRSREDLRLNSFASFLGSAQTLGLKEPVVPLPEPLLGKLLSRNVLFEKTNPSSRHTCSFPSLLIKNEHTSMLSAQKGMSQKETAAFNLAFPVFVDNADVETAPVTLITNFSESFMSLVDSRLRTSKNALIQEIIKRGGSSEAKALLKILSGGASSSSPVSLTTIVTSLRALPRTDESTGNEVFLPLIFESTLDNTVLGTTVTVTVQTSGTISGTFHDDGLFERLEIVFDTITLLESMMKQVRHVVKKVIARAAGIAHKMVKTTSNTNTNAEPPPPSITSVDETFSFNKHYRSTTKGMDYEYDTKKVAAEVTSSSNLFPQEISSTAWDFTKPAFEPSKMIVEKTLSKEEKQQPYQLFSWLAGDDMMLKDADQEMFDEQLRNAKKKKVSFA